MDMLNYELTGVEYEIDEISDYSQYASLGVGSNGDTSGIPTFSAGDDQGEEMWGYKVWDDNTSGEFNSGQVPVLFTGDTSGNESLTVGSSSPVSYAGDSFSSISYVQFQAAVQIPASASWSNISINFYNGSQLVETDSMPTGPAVDTTSTPSNPQAEQFLFVSPTASNVNRFAVSATMQMHSPTGSPGPADMFCNISIYSG